MQYERYHGKITKLKHILDTVRRFRVLILSVVGVCVALTSGYLGAQGYVYEDVPCPESIFYGDELPYRASAVFRDELWYEYAEDSEFTTVLDAPPRLPGEYFVRAVSTSSFGTPRYGEVCGFSVLPRALDVYVEESTLPYGDSPTVTAETVYGDSIFCDVFAFDDPTQTKTSVTPVTETIVITDTQGNDITYAYTLNPLPIEIEFVPREITVTVSDAEGIYNGLPLTFDGYELSAGTLATHTDGTEDRLIATFRDSLTDAGSIPNVPEIKVVGFGHLDVTANYAITLVAGELTVKKYPVQIHVSDATLEYTGKEQVYQEFTVSEDTPLIEGHTASVTESTRALDSGSVENLLLFDVYDGNGQKMSDNYSVFVSESFITVQKRAITVTTADGHWVYDGESHGSNQFTVTSDKQIADGETPTAVGETRITGVGESGTENIFTVALQASDGRDVTHNYEISYVYGALTMEPKPIRFASESADLVYNGLSQTHGGFTLDADTALAEGHTAFASQSTEITNVSEGEVENRLTLLVRDSEGGDQTANYVFEQTEAGTIRILPRPITVTADDTQKTYDGTPLTGESVSVDNLAEGQTLTADLLGSRTTVGTAVVTVDEASVSIVSGEAAVDMANYTLSFAAGTLTVTKRPVTILSADDTRVYDGTALSNGTVTALDLVEGHTAQVESLTEIVNVWDGPADNVVSVTVRGTDGEDLSENYEISYKYGLLTVTPRPITVISEDHDWVYDGDAHSWNGHALSDETPLVEGHRTEAVALTEIVNVRDGSAETPADNEILVTVLASDGEDMTANYDISYVCGGLAIIPKPVTVITEGHTFTYDGNAHSYDSHAVSAETPLVEGHRTNVLTLTEIVNVWDGPIPNELTVAILNGNDEDITANYDISYECGELAVDPLAITVITEGHTFVYSGLAQTWGGHAVSPDTPLVAGHRTNVLAYTEIVNVWDGPIPNVLTVAILNGNGEDMTANYDISYEYGELAVDPLSITVITESHTFIYNGLAQTWGGHAVSTETPLVEGHRTDVVAYTEIVNVWDGPIQNKLAVKILNEDDEDMTANYEILYECGELSVDPLSVTVITEGHTFVYNGLAQYWDTHTVSPETPLVEGHRTDVVAYTEIVNVWDGPIQNELAVKILNEDDEDMTANYEILYEYGELAVDPLAITVITESHTFIYNGLAQYWDTHTVSLETPLVEGHRTDVVAYTEIVNVWDGPIQNELAVKILNEDDEDMTANYEILYEYGELAVDPLAITVITESHTFIYNGLAQYWDGHTVSAETPLVEGHRTDVVAYTEIVNVWDGPIPNELTVAILNGNDEDMTANYEIFYEYGELAVDPLPITVITESHTFIYNGLAQYWDGHTVSAETPLVEGHRTNVLTYTEITNVWDGPIPNELTVAIFNGNNEDMTANYDISYEYGELAVDPLPITVITESHTFVYNGLAQYWDGHTVSAETPLVEGHRTDVVDYTEIVNVWDGPIQNELAVKILNEDDEDMTANYEILYEYGELAVDPLPITVITESHTFIYNGLAQTWGGHAVSIETPLVEGHRTNVLTYTEIVNVWDGPIPNVLTVAILNGNDEDMTANYDISYEYGELAVDPLPITVITEGNRWTYDGEIHSWIGHVVSPETPLVEGHRTNVLTYTEIVNVWDGPIPNVLTVAILNGNGEDMTANYDISYEYGELRIDPRPVTVITGSMEWVYDGEIHSFGEYLVSDETPLVTGHITKLLSLTEIVNVWDGPAQNVLVVGIFNGSNEDMTANYEILYEYGELAILPRPVTVITGSMEWVYDGEIHSFGEYLVSPMTPLVTGHQTELLALTEIVNVWEGSAESPARNKLKVAILDAEGEDMTANYAFTYEYGELVIHPKPITLISESMEWIYDGLPHDWKHFTFAEENALVRDHTAEAVEWTTVTNVADSGKRNALRIRIWCDGVEQTENYAITYLDEGILTIHKRPIRVLTGSGRWEYDGRPHCNPTVETFGEYGLVLDHYFVAQTPYPHITEVRESLNGPVPNVLTVVIVNEAGEDCTENYEILEYAYGGLEIYKRRITVAAKDATKEYDGTPLFCDDYVTFREDGAAALVLDHRIDRTNLTITGSVTEVQPERTPNILTGIARVLTEDGRDVTENYDISYANGELWITPRKIVITAGSASKVYDATPLTCDQYSVTRADPNEIALVLNHQIMAGTILIEGTITNVGKVPNIILNAASDPARIYDPATGRDVTFNYEVTYLDGELEIIPRKIIISSGSAEKNYDGTPLTCPTYEMRGENGMEPLVNGHILSEGCFTVTGTITDPGRVGNTIEGEALILADGVSVTENYEIILEEGTLTVIPDTPEDGGEGGEGGEGGDIDASGDINGGPLGGDNGDGKPPVALKLWSTAGGPIYLRYTSFGSFNGHGFNSAPVYGSLLDERYAYTYLAGIAMKNAGLSSNLIKVVLNTNQLFLPYYMRTGEFNYDIQSSDVLYTGELHEFWLDYYAYTGSGKDLVAGLGDYAEEEAAYREFVYRNYLDLYDEETKAFMERIIAENGFDANDPLIIEKVARFIQESAVYDLEYDRALDKAPNVAIAFLSEYKTGICQHYATAATLLYRALGIPARYTIGYTTHATANEWVEVTTENAHAWVEVYIDGVGWIYSEVTGSGNGGGAGGGGGSGDSEGGDQPSLPLELTPVDVEVEYDGNPHYALPELLVQPDSLLAKLLLEGYTYEVTVEGCQTEIGESAITITSFVLRDPTGQDVTDRYEIICKTGVIRVTKEQVIINLFELQKFYDGTELRYSPDDYWVSKPLDVTVLLDLSGCAITEAGVLDVEELRKLAITILDANGNDVTDEYYVKFVGQPLCIDQRAITIRSASETKTYDGTPLTNDAVSLVFGELVEGHVLDAHATGSITFDGTVKNTIDVETLRILDAEGNDVTANYNITFEEGELTVIS